MIRVAPSETGTAAQMQAMLQRAVELELATLPPYLYALFSAGPANSMATDRLHHIVHEEMLHMALACNILNAIGGKPVIADASVVPRYPGALPFHIDDGRPIRLLPFSPEAMEQGMQIEEPEHPLDIKVLADTEAAPTFPTIGQFYDSLREPLQTLDLPWDLHPELQLGDQTVFPGELFPIHGPDAAVRAIDRIVSEGEGSTETPLDFAGEVSHFYRFQEMRKNKLLQRAPDQPLGFGFGRSLGISWTKALAVAPFPDDPDFSGHPEVQAAQDDCDRAFTSMLREIERAVRGEHDRLGHAVADMLTLGRAADVALTIPYDDRGRSLGPGFRFRPDLLA